MFGIQHTEPLAPGYKPLAVGTPVILNGKPATIVAIQPADSIASLYGDRHSYTVEIHGTYGNYRQARIKPRDLKRR